MITEVIENSKSDDYNDEKMIAAFSTIQISQFAYCSGSCSCGILYFRKEDEKMANVFDTAKYILEQSGSMSTMKLQKLCYYSQVMVPYVLNCFSKHKGSIQQVPEMRLAGKAIYPTIKKTP